MSKQKNPVNLASKFDMAEYDFVENIQESVATPEKNENVLTVVKNLSTHFLSFTHSCLLFIDVGIKKLLTYTTVFFRKSAFELNRKREQEEQKTEDYLKFSMDQLEESDLQSQLIENQNDEVQTEFAMMLNATFGDIVCTTSMNYNPEFNEAVRESVEYSAEVLSFINTKLIEARLDSNLNFVEISYRPKIEDKKIIFSVRYDLVQKGSVWSNIFASFIMKKLSVGLKGADGSAIGNYSYNTSLGIETFSLTIIHDLVAEKNKFLPLKENTAIAGRVQQLSM